MIKQNSFFSVNYIDNVENTYNFWHKIGIEIVMKESDKLVINLGNFEVHYILASTEPFSEYQFATKKAGRGQGVLTYFAVDKIEEFHTKVQEAAPIRLTEIKDNHWNSREFLFSDPDGFLFVVYEY